MFIGLVWYDYFLVKLISFVCFHSILILFLFFVKTNVLRALSRVFFPVGYLLPSALVGTLPQIRRRL